jgi:5'-nucleotidase
VISEVYGAGGNSGALFNADFVELYNPSTAPISLIGLAVHYRSATGGSGGSPYALAGSVAPGEHFLVQMSAPGANGAALPAPDATATPAFSMAAAGGQVYLLNGTTAITDSGDLAGRADIVDMVGLATATSFETAAGPGASSTQSAQRGTDGADTDNNAADFTLAAPTPTPGGGTPPPPPPASATIAEIQGTDAAVSPLLGQTVTTRGVVTAAYPTGGFNGFFMQTEGTGGGTDATPGASDGIYVFGSAAMAVAPQIGDLVEVTAPVSEFAGLTELVPAAGGVVKLTDAPAPVTPLAAAYPTTEPEREAHESELLAPTDTFTVTNNFTTNQFAEIWLATGTTPLVQPTDVAVVGSPEYDAVVADNAARKVVLDDASSINFLSNATNKAIPLPWLSPTNTVRVGARATLQAPVILDYRNNAWKFQPTHQVTDEGGDVATFTDTRTAAPEPVGGDLRLATFNVLNYFNTTGVDFVAAGGTCTYFTDRDGNPVTNNNCSPDGPRGAAEAEDLIRQQDKIVAAINTLDADIVSLEEIENSVKLLGETDRDDAVSALVAALNDAAGTTRWAYAPSPDPADLPDLAEQDVIRTAFIYNPDTVALVGGSQVLVGNADFSNAREPLAQVFKPVGGADAEGFAVVVNHFKSKGDSSPPATGDNANGPQGAFNGDRTRQAAALVDFANAFAVSRGVAKVFLTGDFNSYTQEDPMQVLYQAGFAKVESDDPADTSYSFSGLSGSLDHVLANDAARARVTGADLWEINANESVAFEYSRHNYNVTDFYAPNAFRASDHNPEIVGIATARPVRAKVHAWAHPQVLRVQRDATTLSVLVTAKRVRPTGLVRVSVDGVEVATVALSGGRATVPIGPFDTTGRKRITVTYLGDPYTLPASTRVTIHVVRKR